MSSETRQFRNKHILATYNTWYTNWERSTDSCLYVVVIHIILSSMSLPMLRQESLALALLGISTEHSVPSVGDFSPPARLWLSFSFSSRVGGSIPLLVLIISLEACVCSSLAARIRWSQKCTLYTSAQYVEHWKSWRKLEFRVAHTHEQHVFHIIES